MFKKFYLAFRVGAEEIRGSKFAKDAVGIALLNILVRIFGFFGTAYAAKCLGPTNLGVSAIVQTTANQLAIAFDGGFNVTGVRAIAENRVDGVAIGRAIIAFRFSVSSLLAFIWIIGVINFAPIEQRLPWLLGAPILMLLAINITFIFQGFERLISQIFINAVSVLMTTAAYFIFFKPNMFMGADLIVICASGFFVASLSWYVFYKIDSNFFVMKIDWKVLKKIILESRVYWINSIVGTVYPAIQIFLVTYCLGLYENGIYRAALNTAGAMELLFNSINSILLARLIEWKKQGIENLWKRQHKVTLFLGFILLPVAATLILLAPLMFSTLFGSDFQGAIIIFQIAIIAKIIVILGQPYSWGLVALRQDVGITKIQLGIALISVTINLIAIPVWGLNGAIICMFITDFCYSAACFILARNVINKSKLL